MEVSGKVLILITIYFTVYILAPLPDFIVISDIYHSGGKVEISTCMKNEKNNTTSKCIVCFFYITIIVIIHVFLIKLAI